MKKIISVIFLMTTSILLMAGEPLKIPTKFDVTVSFGSMASGPSSDVFLKTFIKKFSKKYSIVVVGYKAAACGREGEFNILFSLTGLKSTVKKKFLAELNNCVSSQQKKNKAKDENSGNISLEFNKNKDDFNFCREGIKTWK